MAYWTQTDLEDRIGAELVRQILDDDRDGTADTGPLGRLQKASDSFVDGALLGIYDLAVIRAAPPNRVVELSLDVAEWMVYKRRPESARVDWKELKEQTDEDLMRIRKGVYRLDIIGPPEPNAIQGGEVWDGGPSLVVSPCKVFVGGMGDF